MKIKGITNIKYFSKGRRGLIYTGTYKNIKVAIKTKNPESRAIERVKNEINFLQILNKYNVGPKLLMKGENYFVYEFQEGVYFDCWIKNKSKKEILRVLKKLFKQAYIMDRLNIDKEEMLRPYKNVIIKKYNIPVLIDFERCHKVLSSKNVNQLMQFMINNNLVKKNIKLLKKYKENKTKTNFENLMNLF